MTISSIDELLMGGNTSQQPMSPEEKTYNESEPEEVEEIEPETPEYEEADEEAAPAHDDDAEHASDDDEKEERVEESEIDEYGNKKERMSKGMKERLDRKEKQHQREIEQRVYEINQLRTQLAQQGAPQNIQQATKDFEYDPESSGDWQQQLASFVKQTVQSMTHEEQDKQRRHEESQNQSEFMSKFKQGMSRFDDFVQVVEKQPIDNEMTLALRGMDDPAAFIYAASKREPQELERISKLRDPYARVREMGKLEERMRKNKPTTKAPRPLGRTQEDAITKTKAKEKDSSGDDLLARADAKRLSTVKTRLKGNR